MEFQNKIMLRGIVGRAEVSTFTSGQVCNFSLVTEYSTVDRERNSAIETTWVNVNFWNNREGGIDLYAIQKGAWVEVLGRLRMRKYTTQENEEKTAYDIAARKVTVIPREDEHMQPQRDW